MDYYNIKNPKFKFERLKVWQKAMAYGDEIDILIGKLPDKEKFNLSSQSRRAVDSIALNISEGSIGQSDPEYRKFLGYSIRSLAEVITCLYKMKSRNYITDNDFKLNYDEAYHLMNMLIALRNSIN